MTCAHNQAPRLPDAVNDPCHASQMNGSSDSIDREERRRRALSIIGAFSSGVDDLSVTHDHYLAEAYATADGDE